MKIEVHHIKQESEGGESTSDNAIALCFECHADMRSYDHKHPKGNKYSEVELKRHRDSWYEKVAGNIGVANRATVVETDKQVYQNLVDVLPWDGGISFIRIRGCAEGPFKLSLLDELFEYKSLCKDNPAFEFIDPDLEGMRATLLHHIDELTYTTAMETFPMESTGFNSVPQEWDIEQPERFHNVVTKIRKAEQQVVDTYDSLIRTATRKLGVLPDKMTYESGDASNIVEE